MTRIAPLFITLAVLFALGCGDMSAVTKVEEDLTCNAGNTAHFPTVTLNHDYSVYDTTCWLYNDQNYGSGCLFGSPFISGGKIRFTSTLGTPYVWRTETVHTSPQGDVPLGMTGVGYQIKTWTLNTAPGTGYHTQGGCQQYLEATTPTWTFDGVNNYTWPGPFRLYLNAAYGSSWLVEEYFVYPTGGGAHPTHIIGYGDMSLQ